MKAYIFFSVHQELFHRMSLLLRERGVSKVGGFLWGQAQERSIVDRGINYDPLVVFTRDLLPKCNDGAAPNVAWLQQRERELGFSLQRTLTSERHLLEGRSYEQTLRMAEVALREIAATYDRARPDFVFSEDISCFHSYVHFLLAQERQIPFWCIGTGRLSKRVSVYSAANMKWERLERTYDRLRAEGLDATSRQLAEDFVASFRSRPVRPHGMALRAERPSIGAADVTTFGKAVRHYFADPHDPTMRPPHEVIQQRLRRIARVAVANARNLFERPVDGESYVLYPIHFQPEASTLVRAPMYLDQVQLLEDIAKSLPMGVRLYVKEHVSNRGRRPISFYEAIKRIPAVRLLGPDEDTFTLIKNAAVIAVITGTAGWEGLLFDKPVVSFGDVFFNKLPQVYRASEVPKDGWYEMFRKAAFEHRPDPEAVLAMVAALHESSYPGFISNPSTFPEALEPDNVQQLVDALAAEAGLKRSS